MSVRYYSEVYEPSDYDRSCGRIYRETTSEGVTRKECVATVWDFGSVEMSFHQILTSEVPAFVDVLTDVVRRLPPEVQR